MTNPSASPPTRSRPCPSTRRWCSSASGRTSTTWPRIERARRFAVNILGEHQEELSRLFATRGVDRFAQVDWHHGIGGSPVLHDVIAYIDCEFWTEYDGGDHIIVVGRVLDLGITHHAGPLLFYRGEYVRITPQP